MQTRKERIGFIGLGVMGKPMALNLIKTGYELTVYDVNPQPVDELVKAGASRGKSPQEVAGKSDVIFTMLPDSPHVEEVVSGKEGILEGAAPGSIIIDTSSILL